MYYVTATVAPCLAIDSVTVYVLDEYGLTMPNAFTPNGDQSNDFVYPVMLPGTILNEYMIYDRWGAIIYEGPDVPGWDGTYKDKPMPADTYVAKVKWINTQGVEVVDVYDVTLIR